MKTRNLDKSLVLSLSTGVSPCFSLCNGTRCFRVEACATIYIKPSKEPNSRPIAKRLLIFSWRQQVTASGPNSPSPNLHPFHPKASPPPTSRSPETPTPSAGTRKLACGSKCIFTDTIESKSTWFLRINTLCTCDILRLIIPRCRLSEI